MITVAHPLDSKFVPADAHGVSAARVKKSFRIKNSGLVVSKGTLCTVRFGTLEGQWVIRASGIVSGESIGCPGLVEFSMLTRKVEWFYDRPPVEELEEAYESGGSISVLGERVEPDGFDEFGSPSWLMVA